MISKLLIANRGEIVIRIIKACRDLGIKTVAVYSDADKNAPYTREADEAYNIGHSIPAKSYLNIDTIMAAVEKSGADAIHPGYGFLAENADFAKAVVSKGIIWIGPPPDVMSTIESKCYCRSVADRIHIPIVPGTVTSVKNVDEIYQYLSKFGGPLFLKLDKGGGGKGIELITKEEEIQEVYGRVRRIGQLAFASPDCYIEKRLDRPRHIEVQFLADNYGNYVSLGERECSIQRRHQKIIEESPSPVVNDVKREQISEWAIKLAQAMGCTNAGTMEFLRSENRNFYFMEVNARLQVEHPVTEFVTGIDIVKNQLKIASGESLEIKQGDIKINGHAIEARIYAENPNTFHPSPGTIQELSLPASSTYVRIDHALERGISIPPYYDPLIAKVIVWGKSRDEAIATMKNALSQFNVKGIDTTVSVNEQIINKEEYVNGELNTEFIDDLLIRTRN